MKSYFWAHTVRAASIGSVVVLVAFLMSACAISPRVTARGAPPLRIAMAFAAKGDLWLARPDASLMPLTRLHLTSGDVWSTLFWSPDTTQLAATVGNPQAPDAPQTLVIVNVAAATAISTPQAVAAHYHIAGWIANDWLLLAGDSAAPGLSAYHVTDGTLVTITQTAVATFTLAADAVWFVSQQQQSDTGAVLSRWGVVAQTVSAAAFLPGFGVTASGVACGRIHLTPDGALILYDSLFTAATIPCASPRRAEMMAIATGSAWSVFGTSAPAPGAFRDFALDPGGQWATEVTIAASGDITAQLVATTNTATPTTLPTITGAGAPTSATTIVANVLIVVTPAAHAANSTTLVLLPLTGSPPTQTSVAGTDVSIAPAPITSVTSSNDSIPCPSLTTQPSSNSWHIAVIGDSLTQGYGTTNPAQCNFGMQLGAMPLPLAGPPQLLVQGMGGYRADQMLTSVPAFAAFAPDMVVIELGTNDERERWPLDQTLTALTTIATVLQQAAGTHTTHPTVVCLSAWPSPDFDTPAQLAPYNAVIAQVCAQVGGTYVDIATLAVTGMMDNTIAPDFNWHPNNRGALNLARLIMSTLGNP